MSGDEEELWRPAPKRPYIPRDPGVTSAMMATVRARDNKAERLLRRALWAKGLRYRLQRRDITGRPDLVFSGPRVVVFVDGDFWHARAIRQDGEAAFRATMRTSRQDWWIQKLQRTISRDDEVTQALSDAGWTVLRFWESDVLRDVDRAARRVLRAVRRGDGRRRGARSRRG